MTQSAGVSARLDVASALVAAPSSRARALGRANLALAPGASRMPCTGLPNFGLEPEVERAFWPSQGPLGRRSPPQGPGARGQGAGLPPSPYQGVLCCALSRGHPGGPPAELGSPRRSRRNPACPRRVPYTRKDCTHGSVIRNGLLRLCGLGILGEPPVVRTATRVGYPYACRGEGRSLNWLGLARIDYSPSPLARNVSIGACDDA